MSIAASQGAPRSEQPRNGRTIMPRVARGSWPHWPAKGANEETSRVGADRCRRGGQSARNSAWLSPRPACGTGPLEATSPVAAQDSAGSAAGLQAGLRAEQVSLTLLKLDPKNVTSANNLGVAHQRIAAAHWAQES